MKISLYKVGHQLGAEILGCGVGEAEKKKKFHGRSQTTCPTSFSTRFTAVLTKCHCVALTPLSRSYWPAICPTPL